MKLLCAKCGKECDANELRVCSECGAFFCGTCGAAADNLCPECFGRLNKLC